MPKAAIDIGSNSILLAIVDDEGAVLHDEANVVGLGTGLGDKGMFAPDRMAAAEAVLAGYSDTAMRHGVKPWNIKIAATSAARRAMNAETFFGKLTKKHQLRVKIITGEEEARLSWMGSTQAMSGVPDGALVMVDLGGGSTELVNGRGDTIYSRVSLELGSARLTERFLADPIDREALEHTRNYVDIELSRVEFKREPQAIIGVAGTVTTLSAMALGMTEWDAGRVHGTTLSRVDLERFIAELAQATPAERELMAAVAPKRAPYLVAGAIVLERILATVGHPGMLVSDRGLRYGLLST